MQQPGNQNLSSGQAGGLQPGMVTVPMSVNSSGQNVVVTAQNLGSGQPNIIPNVQILNMRPGAPSVSAQKSVAAVSPRVVIGSPQVVNTRPGPPGITMQTLQTLQAGQQGHLLLKTENGQYQLLRVGPAPGNGSLGAPPSQAIRLSSVPAHSGVATVSTSVASLGSMGQMTMPIQQLSQSMVNAPNVSNVQNPQPTILNSNFSNAQVIKPQLESNTKEKCRNFLANLLDLSSKEPPSVELNVRNLIQELIDCQVEPDEFCDRLERLLNASPQPCLIGFLKKSLPLLRQSLVLKELVIEGINAPPQHVAFPNIAPQSTIITGNVPLNIPMKPVPKPGGSIAVLQNIPVHTKIPIVNKSEGGKIILNSKTNFQRSQASAALSTVLTPGKSLLREKERKPTVFPAQFCDDKMAGDDDINDVAAMGGVNLQEETQRILGNTDMIGTQIRSCKEEYLVPSAAMMARIKAICAKQGLDEPPPEVAALMSHALQERLKTIVEKLTCVTQHRIDPVTKTDGRYEVTQDVKGQLKFLEELDRVDKKRREDSEREMLLRAAKSRSKNEDPEQAKLKAKAKEMQRAELEELRQRAANLTALQAIGPRKKARLDGPGEPAPSTSGSVSSSNSNTGRGQLALRTRLKRINLRDMLYMMENDREFARSPILYKAYLM